MHRRPVVATAGGVSSEVTSEVGDQIWMRRADTGVADGDQSRGDTGLARPRFGTIDCIVLPLKRVVLVVRNHWQVGEWDDRVHLGEAHERVRRVGGSKLRGGGVRHLDHLKIERVDRADQATVE